MKQDNQLTIQGLYKTIKALPLALMAGLCLMSVAVLFFNQGKQPDGMYNEIFVIGLACLAGIAIVGGSYLFRKKVEACAGKNLAEKLVIYREAILIKFALLEGPALIGLALFFISANYLFMIITGTMFLVMLMNRPTDDMIAQHLSFTESEKRTVLLEEK